MTFSCFCASSCAVKILMNLAESGSFICICIIVSLSKRNPFKSQIIGEINRYYFKILANNDSYSFNNSMNDNITIDEMKEKMFNDTDTLYFIK